MRPNEVIDLRLEDNQRPVRAGELFRLRVTLTYETDKQLELVVEKQRVVHNGSQPELFAAVNYFDIGPVPITVRRGESAGISEPIQVRLKPGPPDYPLVEFPDVVLFTILRKSRVAAGSAVTILYPGPARR